MRLKVRLHISNDFEHTYISGRSLPVLEQRRSVVVDGSRINTLPHLPRNSSSAPTRHPSSMASLTKSRRRYRPSSEEKALQRQTTRAGHQSASEGAEAVIRSPSCCKKISQRAKDFGEIASGGHDRHFFAFMSLPLRFPRWSSQPQDQASRP